MLHFCYFQNILNFTIIYLEPFNSYGHTYSVLSCHYYHSNALGYTIFLVFPSITYMYKRLAVPTLKKAAYSWPCEKHAFSKLIPANLRDYPCALFIFVANASLMGNCSRFNWTAYRLVRRGRRGIKTFSFLAYSVMMVASIKLGMRVITHSLVPLHIFGGSMFRNNIGVPTFKVRMCGGLQRIEEFCEIKHRLVVVYDCVSELVSLSLIHI